MNLLEQPIIYVHGFGMRGFFWKTLLEAWNNPELWFSPDLNFSSVLSGRDLLVDFVEKKAKEVDRPIILVGHSLGGILSALALSKLTDKQVSHVIILMAPWLKEKRNPLEKLIGFLIRHRLLPGALVMERFFSTKISVEKQKELFDKAVQEELDLAYEITTQTWFDPTLFKPHANINVLGIGSDHDRIVPSRSVEELTQAVGGRFYAAPYPWGHDDFGVDSESAKDLITYLSQLL